MQSLDETGKLLNQYVLTDCGSCFASERTKTNTMTARGDDILPLMQNAMDTVIAENTHLTDRAKAMLEILNGDMAISVLPQPEPLYEYQYHLGDTVYIGNNKYDVVSIDDNSVLLYDDTFPLINKEMSRNEFNHKVEENPHNDHLRVIVEEKSDIAPKEESPYSQYLKIKEDYPLDVVTFEVGDFFEFYLEDAKIAADIIGLHLCTRVIDGEYVSMCGIPRHKFEEYTEKILAQGHNVVVHGKEENTGEIKTFKIVSEHKYEKPQMVETNIGEMPIEDYQEIQAIQYGFDSYEDLKNQGYSLPYATEEKDNSDLIGKYLTIDNRKYIIEGVRSYGDVEMRDITFENAVGFPINRLENAEYIRKLLAEKEKEDLTPAFEKKLKPKVDTFILHPEIKLADRNQYAISNDDLGIGTAKEKFRANMVAINLLKELELDNRFATPQEQEILSNYVGFGGLADAFDENKSAWANEFAELYATLSPDEYEQARESTLTAFYTPPIVIKSMYKALENMGYKQGNILEPSCGIGNFIGMLPDSMKDSKD